MEEHPAAGNNEGQRIIRNFLNRMNQEAEPNPGLKTLTSLGMKTTLGGSLILGAARQSLPKGEESLMLLVGVIAAMLGLVGCVSSILLWRNYTKAIQILAKIGCFFTAAAVLTMFSLALPDDFAWVALILSVGITIPFIWKA